MQIRLKQIGLNLIISYNNTVETITLPNDYNFDKIFALAQKCNQGIKLAEKLFEKEVALYRKQATKNEEVLNKRIERNKIKKEIKTLQSFNYDQLPIFIPDEWKELINSKENSKHIENFLMWLSLCDNKYTRENFLKSFDTKYCYITPNGFIASLRQVWKKEENDALYDVVQSKWKQIKAVWKKSPKSYGVYSKGGVYLVSTTDPDIKEQGWDFEGNLDDLYTNYKPIKRTTYTSDYAKRNGSSIIQEDWSVGDIITMPNKATHGEICGIRQYHILQNPLDVITEVNGKYGDTIALVLVNPARVISIEAGWKYTCDEWYFAAVMDKEDVQKQFNEQWGLFEHDYLEKNIEEIKSSIIKSKEKEIKADKQIKIKDLKASLKTVLNNKTEHIEPTLYNEILSNRISLLK